MPRRPTAANLALLAALGLALVAGCKKSGPPAIGSITGDSVVKATDSADYTCSAWDVGGGTVDYRWSCSRGTFESDTASSVRWNAPESSGQALLGVRVTDEDGLWAEDSFGVRVERKKTTVINYWGAVKAQDFREWGETLRLGYELEGFFTLDTGRVTFLILDQENFERWLQRTSFQYLVARFDARTDSFSAVVPVPGRHRFVIDNSTGKLDLAFGLVVEKTTP